jgi:geranylgeranylglycerol-phosphate geranylgeranyltransferase
MILNYQRNIKPFSDLIRIKTSMMAGIGFILGLWIAYKSKYLSINTEFVLQSFLGFLGGFILSGAMNTFNDIKDLEIDRIIKPNRPLPRSAVTVRNAKLFAFLLTSIAIVITIILFSEILVYLLLIIFLGFLYSYGFQKIPVLKNFLVAFLISTPLLLSAWIIERENVFSNKLIMNLFSLAVISFMLFEWLKDLIDLEGDSRNGKITIPVIIGSKSSAILIFSGFSIILFLFWSYLGLFQLSFAIIAIMIVQLLILLSSSKIIWNQTPFLIDQARKQIYVIFAITMLALFVIV